MNIDQPSQEVKEPEVKQEAPVSEAVESPMSKFDAPVLKGIGSSAMVAAGTTAFLPQNMGEAMEFAKLMAASNFVPPHLRGRAGDCLAIVMQSTRWGMDPYAVANKTYFVNDRMAFEAQLVNAVVNSSKILDGRLQISWQGSGPTLQCTVRGRIKGDSDVHELIQELSTITTRNSPLWKQAPKVQIAYHTTRSWGRVYTPEVLLGVYTPEEIEDTAEITIGTQTVIPPRPTRLSAEQERAAADRLRKEQVANDAHHRSIKNEETVDHNPETGELIEPEKTDDGPAPASSPDAMPHTPSQPAAEVPDNAATSDSFQSLANELIAAIQKTGRLSDLKVIIQKREEDIDLLRTDADDIHKQVMAAIEAKRAWFAK